MAGKPYPIFKQLYPIFEGSLQKTIRCVSLNCEVLYPIMRATFGEKHFV